MMGCDSILLSITEVFQDLHLELFDVKGPALGVYS